MRTTITVRADESLRRALEERAKAQGATVSEVARTILRKALEEQPLERKTAYLRGSLRLQRQGEESWREALRERNWRQ